MRTSTRACITGMAISLVLLASGCRAAGPPQPSPNTPSSTELVESPKIYDGGDVIFTGEAVGEAMARGDYAWLHLNDDAYYVKNVEEGAYLGGYNTGMPVWLPARESDQVTNFGDYKHEGDIVRVSGTFNAACAQHGGDMDIHATTLEVLVVGREVVDTVPAGKIAWAVGLSLLALALYLLNRYWARITEAL